MQQQPDIHRLIDLQKLLLKFQKVDRRLLIPGRGQRRENDVEHSYNLAIAAWFLAQHSPELDQNEVIRTALVHDMVEIHAGDTFIFNNPEGMATKQEREMAALQRLAKEWADFPEMVACLHRYEARETAEARFVYALDKVMPAIMNYLQGGEVWRAHRVTLTDLHELKDDKVALSPQVLPYYRELMDLLAANPQLFDANAAAPQDSESHP